MAELSDDPGELEARAVEVAALAAGISQAQAALALDAAATLLRRATALRMVSAFQIYGTGASRLDRDAIDGLIAQVVAAVEST